MAETFFVFSEKDFIFACMKNFIFHMPMFMLAWNYFIEYLISLKKKLPCFKISKRDCFSLDVVYFHEQDSNMHIVICMMTSMPYLV